MIYGLESLRVCGSTGCCSTKKQTQNTGLTAGKIRSWFSPSVAKRFFYLENFLSDWGENEVFLFIILQINLQEGFLLWWKNNIFLGSKVIFSSQVKGHDTQTYAHITHTLSKYTLAFTIYFHIPYSQWNQKKLGFASTNTQRANNFVIPFRNHKSICHISFPSPIDWIKKKSIRFMEMKFL
jgi:hypothetical protein